MSLSRYRLWYETVVRQDLLSKLQYKNVHQIPKVTQIAVSGATRSTTGKGLDNPIASAFMLELITGQQPKMTRIRRPNARYRTREGFLEGSKVILHGDQMYNFMDRLVTMVLPRVTEFSGLRHSSFDGRGNYAIGISDMNYFLEIEAQHANMMNFQCAGRPSLLPSPTPPPPHPTHPPNPAPHTATTRCHLTAAPSVPPAQAQLGAGLRHPDQHHGQDRRGGQGAALRHALPL